MLAYMQQMCHIDDATTFDKGTCLNYLREIPASLSVIPTSFVRVVAPIVARVFSFLRRHDLR